LPSLTDKAFRIQLPVADHPPPNFIRKRQVRCFCGYTNAIKCDNLQVNVQSMTEIPVLKIARLVGISAAIFGHLLSDRPGSPNGRPRMGPPTSEPSDFRIRLSTFPSAFLRHSSFRTPYFIKLLNMCLGGGSAGTCNYNGGE